MARSLSIASSVIGWLLVIPGGLLIWEMTTPQMTFALMPSAYALMFGSLLVVHFGAKLCASRLLAPARAPRVR